MINVLLLIFWGLVKFLKKNSVRNDLITSLVISNFIFQPSVIDMMTRVISCEEIDPDKFYISAQLDQECFTDQHNTYIKYLSVPFLLIWCLLAPGLILFYLIIRRYTLNDRQMAAKFGFFYFGYREKFFYWEFLVMFKKIVITFIAVFLISNNLLKAMWAILVLCFSVFLQIKINPFDSEELNTMELRSSIVSLGTLFFGLLNYLVDSNGTKIILFFIVAFLNAFFLGFWGLRMILVNISKLHLCFKAFLKRFFPSYTKDYKRFFSASK